LSNFIIISNKRARKIRGVYVYSLHTHHGVGSVVIWVCRSTPFAWSGAVGKAQGTSVFVEAGRNVMISSEGLVEMHIPKLLTQVLQNQQVARTITPLYWIRFLTFQHFLSKGFDIST